MNHRQGRLTIGMLINQIDGAFQSQLWRGLQHWAEQRSVNLIYFAGKSLNSPVGNERFSNFLYGLPSPSLVDGLVVSTATIAMYSGDQRAFFDALAPLPMVSLSEPVPGLPSVVTDSKDSMKALISHLIEGHGVGRIGCVRGPVGFKDSDDRYQAFVEALGAHGLPLRDDLVFVGDFQTESGRLAAERWLAGPGLPEAIVACNDEMAMGVLEALSAHGIRVPDDVLVTGFDDIDQAKYLSPALTTVSQPIFDLSYRGGEILLDRIEGRSVPEVTTLPSAPVFRESCGCVTRRLSRSRYVRGRSRGPDTAAPVRQSTEFPATPRLSFQSLFDQCSEALRVDLTNGGGESRYARLLEQVVELVDYDREEVSYWKSMVQSANERILDGLAASPELPAAEEIVYKAELRFMDRLVDRENDRFVDHSDALWKLRHILSQFGSTRTAPQLFEKIAASFPTLGIQSAYVRLFQDPLESPAYNTALPASRLAMAYSLPEMPFNGPVSDGEFLPTALLPQGRRFTLFGLPLVSGTRALGVFFCEYGTRVDVAYGLLTEQIVNGMEHCLQIEQLEVAERRLTQTMEALARSEERYREMAFFLPTIVMETDMALRFVYANQACLDLFGLDSGPVGQFSLLDFIHMDDLQRFKEDLGRIFLGEPPDLNMVRLVRRDGTPISILTKASLLQVDQRVEGVRWSGIDVKPLMASVVKPDLGFYERYYLSNREREVVELLLQGYKLREVADKLFISLKTVKAHVTSIYAKAKVTTREALLELVKNYLKSRFGHSAFRYSLLSHLLRD